ncbi:hypothetical protein HBI56_158930 [Parastagonospora nodorum]|uniref:Uncharacterized protein n=1 Tax=Phaeosphaeria nodorum (strain SN15 / ATCC MYA-4574 / FGSC 10173) TaxID=321614 RepID=A0A7U2ET58_PHANO|nr:hypothetical protein HBH56_189650 [Parastagonospora nodorum]QRC92342.1 hypothetical protein JI435_024690 [Parastagonospora nodorum SN15]KAH3925145.1 hypothetical protein HBH54_185460 [Parastagonospora nodorum]KAH3954490.1 hypothetical protein HBH53_024810 [Parastagonospora nodorum]KAH3963823.1 hypothetical protein HBH51_164650 [Parastagonospora nodorum]
MTAPSTQDMGASLQSPTGVEFWLTLTDPAGAHYWYYYCCTRPRSTRCSIASQPPPLLLAVASTARPANVGGSLGRRPSKLPVNAHGHFHRDFLPGGRWLAVAASTCAPKRLRFQTGGQGLYSSLAMLRRARAL